MKKLTVVLAVAALVAAVFAVQALAATKTVKWFNGAKSTITIKKGASVKWVWTDSLSHNAKGKGFSSKVLTGKGKSYVHKFTKKGTFTVICQIHPSSMKTVVRVR